MPAVKPAPRAHCDARARTPQSHSLRMGRAHRRRLPHALFSPGPIPARSSPCRTPGARLTAFPAVPYDVFARAQVIELEREDIPRSRVPLTFKLHEYRNGKAVPRSQSSSDRSKTIAV